MRGTQCRITKEDVNKLHNMLFIQLHLCQWAIKGKNKTCTMRNNYLFKNNYCYELNNSEKVFIFHIVPICVVNVL